MNEAQAGLQPGQTGLNAELLKNIDKTHVGAAVSKLISASIGDICVVLSRSPAYKHYSLSDIEWMVLPAVLTGQFYVAEAASKEHGFRAPLAVITWARVSPEVDARLTENAGRPIRLRPDEWASGDIHWIIHVAGEPRFAAAALQHLTRGPLNDKAVKLFSTDDGRAGVKLLSEVVAAVAAT